MSQKSVTERKMVMVALSFELLLELMYQGYESPGRISTIETKMINSVAFY